MRYSRRSAAACSTFATKTGSSDSSVSGYYGCCGTNHARLQFGSNFANDEATVLIKISSSSSLCSPYTMEYAYGKG